jgi:hypothetical protein
VGLNLSFFDTAATLIPVLLLGGVLSERVRNIAWDQKFGFPALAAIGLFAPFAEITAISVALSDSPAQWQVWVVVLAVAGGTYGLAGAAVWHLLSPVWASGRAGRLQVLAGYGIAIVLSAATLVLSVDLEKLNQADPLRAAKEDTVLRLGDAQDRQTDARLAAGRITRKQAAAEKLRRANADVKFFVDSLGDP